MLMAYEDGARFVIAEYPDQDARIGATPIGKRAKALEILKWAKSQRSDVTWKIGGKGPYRVYGQPL